MTPVAQVSPFAKQYEEFNGLRVVPLLVLLPETTREILLLVTRLEKDI